MELFQLIAEIIILLIIFIVAAWFIQVVILVPALIALNQSNSKKIDKKKAVVGLKLSVLNEKNIKQIRLAKERLDKTMDTTKNILSIFVIVGIVVLLFGVAVVFILSLQ